jgi:phospholipid/cholesterol/gamma-HCH transport system permease protein
MGYFNIYAQLIVDSITRLRVLANPMVKLVFLRQVHVTAVSSLRLVSVVALVIGTAFVKHVTEVLGADPRAFDLVELVLVHNVAPLATAFIIIGRSAAAVSTELAMMDRDGEIRALADLRISVQDYLIVPRVAAITLATAGCCFYFQVIAVIGGFSVSSLMLDISLDDQLRRFAEHVHILGIALDVVKSLCFGFFVAIIACGVGLTSVQRMAKVQQVPAQAFLRALVAVITIDIVFLLNLL